MDSNKLKNNNISVPFDISPVEYNILNDYVATFTQNMFL